jgi:hypothetical protein
MFDETSENVVAVEFGMSLSTGVLGGVLGGGVHVIAHVD